jgi:spermidine synthase
VAGISGLSVTVLEFGAVRFMAPWFGQSNYVWSNVIGVILLALALGYWLGGRIADNSTTGRPLYTSYLLAAAWTVVVTVLGPAICAWLVPADLGSARMLPLAFTGSLAATLLLFAPPVLVLGMTSPFLVRLDDAPGRAGRTAGRIFAIGTLGSLVGCYIAPLWMLQALGSRTTILVCAGALALLGALGLMFSARSTTRSAVAGVLLGLAALGLGLMGASRPLRVDPGQIEEIESAYQTVRVAAENSWVPVPTAYPLQYEPREVMTRFLRHDEDVDTYQSVVLQPPEIAQKLLMGGRYYDHMALAAWFARKVQPKTLDVMVIGYAGGSAHRALAAVLPPGMKLRVLGVEIDPAVVDIARRHLSMGDLESEGLRLITGEDGRTVVNALPEDEAFDLILVDAYAKTTFVPFQLASVECFSKLMEHLKPEGRIGLNLHANGGLDGRLYQSIAKTLSSSDRVGDVWVVPNPWYLGSILLWAGGPKTGAPRVRGDVTLPAPLRTPAFALERLMVRYVPEDERGHVLTDDRSDVDRITQESFVLR